MLESQHPDSQVDSPQSVGDNVEKMSVEGQTDRPLITPQYINYIPDSPEREEIAETNASGHAATDAEGNSTADQEQPLAAREDIYASDTKSNVFLEILDWVKYILLAILIGWLISTFVIQRSEVVGNSMLPTLQNADQLFVEKVSINFGLPGRGAIITIDTSKLASPGSGDVLVKRVIAVPGDTIDFRNGQVILNGAVLDEPYLADEGATSPPPEYTGPIVIPEETVYVMGDNRAHSADSRVFGPVPRDAVMGHIFIRIFPFNRVGFPK